MKQEHQNKWEILPKDHPLVLRRLVRELNGQLNSFFTNGHRYCRARLHKGQLQVCGFDGRWESMGFRQYFTNSAGEEICASRTRCGL